MHGEMTQSGSLFIPATLESQPQTHSTRAIDNIEGRCVIDAEETAWHTAATVRLSGLDREHIRVDVQAAKAVVSQTIRRRSEYGRLTRQEASCDKRGRDSGDESAPRGESGSDLRLSKGRVARLGLGRAHNPSNVGSIPAPAMFEFAMEGGMEKPKMTPELLAGILGGSPDYWPLAKPIDMAGVQIESVRLRPSARFEHVKNDDGSESIVVESSFSPRWTEGIGNDDRCITLTIESYDALPDGVRELVSAIHEVHREDAESESAP